jgi:hypothetical protein
VDLGSRDDRVKAAALLEEGERIAQALDLKPLCGRIESFRARDRLRLARNPAGLTAREFATRHHLLEPARGPSYERRRKK